MKHLILFFAALMTVFSCNTEAGKLKTLHADTDRIHDEAMKDLAEMQRVKRSLKTYLSSAALPPEASKNHSDVLLLMEKADADMSTWMANYKSPDGMDEQAALQLMEEQKKGIERNLKDIRAAIEDGKKLLSMIEQ
jgi:hypothetical protein